MKILTETFKYIIDMFKYFADLNSAYNQEVKNEEEEVSFIKNTSSLFGNKNDKKIGKIPGDVVNNILLFAGPSRKNEKEIQFSIKSNLKSLNEINKQRKKSSITM